MVRREVSMSEVHMDKKEVGRGTFGIVYRGMYRGQLVAGTYPSSFLFCFSLCVVAVVLFVALFQQNYSENYDYGTCDAATEAGFLQRSRCHEVKLQLED